MLFKKNSVPVQVLYEVLDCNHSTIDQFVFLFIHLTYLICLNYVKCIIIWFSIQIKFRIKCFNIKLLITWSFSLNACYKDLRKEKQWNKKIRSRINDPRLLCGGSSRGPQIFMPRRYLIWALVIEKSQPYEEKEGRA